MEEKSLSQPSVKRRKRLLGIAAIAILSIILAVVAILSSIDFNRLKPVLVEAVKKETGRVLEIRGAVELHLGFSPSLLIEDIYLQNAPWGSRPDMVRIKRLDIKCALLPLLKKELQITHLILNEPDILVETNPSGTWNFEFEKPEPAGQRGVPSKGVDLSRVAFHQVQIEKGGLFYRDGASKKALSVAIERFIMSSDGMDTPISLSFKGIYDENPFELNGTIGPFLFLKEPNKAYPVDLALKSMGSTVKVRGTVTDMLNLKGMALATSAEFLSASEITRILGISIPATYLPFRVSAEISDPGEKTFSLSDLKISNPAGNARGNLLLKLGGRVPGLSGALAWENLNLKTLLTPENGVRAKVDNGARKARVFPNDPLPLDVLKVVDAQLKLEAHRVQLPYLTLEDLGMEGSLKKGELTVRLITSTIAGGHSEGRLEIRARGTEAVTKALLKANQLDLRLLTPDLKAEGKVDVDLDLLSKGSSIAGLMAGLNGRTVVVMGQGRVENKAIGILGGDLASGMFQILHPSTKDASHTDIRCGVSSFDIQNGIAKVTALLVDTPELSVLGDGQVNLRDETVDLSLKPYPKGGAAGFTLSLGELAKSFKLGGTLANPSLQMDTAQTMLAAGKAAGGVLLFGPAGILAVLAGQSSGESNPCLSAMESARMGARVPEKNTEQEQKRADKGITGTLKGIGDSVKKLFNGGGTQGRSNSPPSPYEGAGP